MSPKLERATAVSLLGLLLTGGVLAAAGPHWVAAQLREEFNATASLAAARERVNRAVGPRFSDAELARALIPGQTGGLNAAELQRMIDDLARTHGLSTYSVQVTSSKQEQGLTEVILDATLGATTDTLRNFVHTLETGLPVLLVDEVTIRAGRRQEGAVGPVPLETTMKIRGYGASKD
jgi:hypothetical protein